MTRYCCDICASPISIPEVSMEVKVSKAKLIICSNDYMLCNSCARKIVEQINKASPTIGLIEDFLMEEDEIEMD